MHIPHESITIIILGSHYLLISIIILSLPLLDYQVTDASIIYFFIMLCCFNTQTTKWSYLIWGFYRNCSMIMKYQFCGVNSHSYLIPYDNVVPHHQIVAVAFSQFNNLRIVPLGNCKISVVLS